VPIEQLFDALVEQILALDAFVAELVVGFRTPLATKLMTSVTGLGSASAAAVFLGLFSLAGWDDEFRVAAAGLALAGGVVAGLMATVGRPFPPHPVCATGGAEAVAASFPSGHAAGAAVFALVATRSEALPSAPTAALAALVAASRIYLGTHYLSDTVAGVLVGAGAFLLADRALARFGGREPRNSAGTEPRDSAGSDRRR